MKEIQLGQSCTKPEAASLTEDYPDTKDVRTYPELQINDHADPALLDVADEGKATVHYQVTHRAEHDNDGKKKHSVTLKIKSITPHSKRQAKRLPGAREDEEAVEKGLR
jgi:ubiquitin